MFTTLRRIAAIATATAVASLGVTTPASAAGAWSITFDADVACTFPLTISGSGDGQKVYREFVDRQGGLRAVLTAGTGQELTYTNDDTAKHFSTRANGAVTWNVPQAEGPRTMKLLGHNVVILFPSDGGPSTTLYTGQVVINVDAFDVWTVVEGSGGELDICAALT